MSAKREYKEIDGYKVPVIDPTQISRDPIADIDLKINFAVSEAMEANGFLNARALKRELSERGLVIVEAAKHDRMLTTLQLLGSAAAAVIKMMEE